MRRSDKPYKFRQIKGRAISVEFRIMPGKRISTGCYDLPSAVLWAERFLAESGAETVKAPTLSEIGRDFFLKEGPDSFRGRLEAFGYHRNREYFTRRQSIVDHYILPAFGSYVVTAITAPAIERFIVGLKNRDTGKPLAGGSKNRVRTVFGFLLDDAKRRGYIQSNPIEDVGRMALDTKEREALPVIDISMLFPPDPDERVEVWGDLMWAVYFSIFYDTGMRPGEIAALRVCDIYQTPNGLAVGTSNSIDTSERHFKEGVKTTGKGMERRIGLLYGDTAELLIRLIEKRHLTGYDLLFRSSRGNVVVAHLSNKHFKRKLKELGLYREGKVQYCIRHTYETDRRGDMPDEVLAISMGHTKLRNDYDHRKIADLIRRLERARGALFESRERPEARDEVIPLEEALRQG